MPDNVITQPAAGGEIVRTPEDAELLQGAFGTQVVDPAVRDAEAADAARRAMFDTWDDKVSTFAEGVVDALSLGFIRETGEAADIRREENSGSAFAGNMVGTVLGLGVPGPAKLIAEGGELVGKTAARMVLREAEAGVIARGLTEAGAGAALTGATAFGHQAMDALIEDRDFSSEAILHEAGIGGVIGLGGGVIIGSLAKAASRAEVAAQEGMLGAEVGVRHFDDAFRAYDDVVRTQEQRFGVLNGLREADRLGPVSDGFMDVRKAALRDAQRAGERFRALDMEKALDGSDPAAFQEWRKAGERYRQAVRDLDDIMRPDAAELAEATARNQKTIVDLNPFGKARGDLADQAAKVTQAGDQDLAHMMRDMAMDTPENLAAYERLHGRPYEFHPKYREPLPDPLAPEAAAKGTPSPSSLEKTNPGRRQQRPMDAGSPWGGGDGPLPPEDSYVGPVPVIDVFGLDAARAAEGPSAALTRKMAVPEAPAGLSELNAALGLDQAASAQRVPQMLETMRSGGATQLESLPRGAAQKAFAADEARAAKAFDSAETSVKASKPTTQAPEFTLDDWMDTRNRVRSIDTADVRAQAAMDDLYAASQGRLDSAGSLKLLERAKVPRSSDSIMAMADNLWSLRSAARHAAAEARGVATPLRKAAEDAIKEISSAAVLSKLVKDRAVRAALGFAGFGGQLAATSGRLLIKASAAAAKLLTSTRVRAIAVAAGNHPWAYGGEPIKDPVERIVELQRMASNPQTIMARVAEAAGDLKHVSPAMVQALQQRAVNQVTRIAMRAPAIYYDKLGNPLMPPAGKMREFHEYENGVHDLDSLLKALANGSITRPQAAALQEAWPSVHVKVAQSLLADPEALQTLSRAQLRVVEMVTGVPLTNASDPMWLARQQQAWQPMEPPAPPSKAQSFSMNPAGAPTPSQASSTGRAPGN